MFVYVAGPLTQGNSWRNVAKAMDATHALMDLGCDVFCPHLSVYLDIHKERPYNEWLDMDLRVIPRMDAIYLLPGDSPGARKECELAASLGIPVYMTLEAVKAHKDHETNAS